MQIRRAVITAAAKRQGTLPMRMLFDQQRVERSVLSLVVKKAIRAGTRDITL